MSNRPPTSIYALAAVLGVGAEWYASHHEDKIILSLGYALDSVDLDTSGGLWLARKDYVAPINAAVLVRVNNLTGAAVGIKQFQASIRDDAGTWRNLQFVQTPGRLYGCAIDAAGLKSVHPVELDGEGLFRVLQNGPVAPLGQITNWLLFEYPRGFRNQSKEFWLRLVMWDQTGRAYTAERHGPNGQAEPQTDSPEWRQNLDPTVQQELDRLIMKTIYQPPVDLSTMRIGHVQDELRSSPPERRDSR